MNHLINFYKPTNYQLKLDIDKKNRKFSGEVVISGETVGNEIRLHAKNLSISKVLVDGEKTSFKTAENDEIIIPKKGSKIEIEWTGKINETDMHGLYLCKYEGGELFATQFESHHAREVFPCIDEPAAKATFDVEIKSNEKIVLSNMPGKNGVFETTPKMSTYLLAFVGGDLISKSGETKNGVEVNIYATPVQKLESLDFALTDAIKCIEFYEDYFGVAYPLPKSDHVALPDFSSGAMENWGLVTYRETCLLAEPDASIFTKRCVATVINHELAHQWFGNLVTMKWWDDLWLNESFANLMEYISTDALWPDFHIWDEYETAEPIYALRRDRLPGVQSVHQTVNHPDEISTLFDGAIVYAKGGRLLKMVWKMIGDKKWRAGLQKYFKNYQYQNTIGDNLWECLGVDPSFMEKWLNQSGFPIVSMQKIGEKLTLTQTQFGVQSDKLWPIPLFTNCKCLPEIFDQKEITVNCKCQELPLLNIGNNGHFITDYNNFELTLKQVKNNNSRLQFLNEYTLMAENGDENTANYVDLLLACKNEKNPAVRDIMDIMTVGLKKFTEDSPELRLKLNRLVSEISFDLWKPLAIKNDELNTCLFGDLIFARNEKAVNFALNIFNKNRHDVAKIDANIRGIVLLAAVKFGDNEDFDYLYDLYKTTNDPTLKQLLCGALTSTENTMQIMQLLDDFIKINIIRPQDLYRWFGGLMNNQFGREFAWVWLKSNWDFIEKTYNGDKSYDTFVTIVSGALQNSAEAADYAEFFQDKLVDPSLKRAIEVGQESINQRATWLTRDKESVTVKLKTL